MIIGLSGYAHAGKDSTAEIMKLILPEWWEIVGFADPLRQIASKLTGFPEEMFKDADFKMSKPEGWEVTVREYLQNLAESLRKALGEDTFVDQMMQKYTPKKNWIVTDVRLPIEATEIVSAGGKIVRIARGYPANNHHTETALDQWNFDYYLDNHKSIVDLIHNIKTMIVDLNLK